MIGFNGVTKEVALSNPYAFRVVTIVDKNGAGIRAALVAIDQTGFAISTYHFGQEPDGGLSSRLGLSKKSRVSPGYIDGAISRCPSRSYGWIARLGLYEAF